MEAKLSRAEKGKEAAETEVGSLAQALGEREAEIAELRAELARARGLMSGPAQKQLDSLIEERKKVSTEPTVSLIGALGMKGELWSQDVIELGMELMEKGLTAPQVTTLVNSSPCHAMPCHPISTPSLHRKT